MLCLDCSPSHLGHLFAEVSSSPTYSKGECESLAAMSGVRDLPVQCQEYPSVKAMMLKRNKSNYAIAFAGMSPADAASAMAARESGSMTHAQFQRRLTTRHHAGKW